MEWSSEPLESQIMRTSHTASAGRTKRGARSTPPGHPVDGIPGSYGVWWPGGINIHAQEDRGMTSHQAAAVSANVLA
jgi:hypothetical protein